VSMMDLYLIFQFVKGRCHNEGKLILRAFFARLPDDSSVSFCYYLLVMPLYCVKFWRRSVQ